MTMAAMDGERPCDSLPALARWRCWLFNRIARWEERSIAKSLGLPAEHLVLIDISADADDRAP
jgi:hypothetical protein